MKDKRFSNRDVSNELADSLANIFNKQLKHPGTIYFDGFVSCHMELMNLSGVISRKIRESYGEKS